MNDQLNTIFQENRARMLQIADKNISLFLIDNDTPLSDISAHSNQFIEIREGNSYHYQTISSSLVIYLMDYTAKTTRHYLISTDASGGISYPTPDMNISELHKHDYLEMFYVISG